VFPWVELFLGWLADVAWPLAVVVVVWRMGPQLRDLLVSISKTWTKGRFRVGTVEGELERKIEELQDVASTATQKVETRVEANAIQPPPTTVEQSKGALRSLPADGTTRETNQEESNGARAPAAGSAAAVQERSSTDDRDQAWPAWLHSVQLRVLEIAAQSPKVAVQYAMSQSVAVLLQRMGLLLSTPANFATLAMLLAGRPGHNPVFAKFLIDTFRLAQDVMAGRVDDDELIANLGFWSSLPQTVAIFPMDLREVTDGNAAIGSHQTTS
jgi:hypothetical protein